MDFGSTVAFAALVIGMIAITGMLLEGYKSRMRVKERELELRIAEASRGKADTGKFEQRLRVLERIATDQSSVLATQIEDLRESAEVR